MMKMTNKDVPDSAIVKQLLIENGKLKSEIDYLNSEIEMKNKAISAFKEWQKKVCEYKWEYWLTEGLNIVGKRPPCQALKKLRSMFANRRIYDEWERKVNRAYEDYMKSIDKVEKKAQEGAYEDLREI